MTHKLIYPFTAIIGQDLMKLALTLNAVITGMQQMTKLTV